MNVNQSETVVGISTSANFLFHAAESKLPTCNRFISGIFRHNVAFARGKEKVSL